MSEIDSGDKLEDICLSGAAMQIMDDLPSHASHPPATPKTPIVNIVDFQPDDETLIRAVLSGETERFTLLVRRYQGRVMRFILKYEYNPHDAQELAQETFLQAYRSLPNFNYQSRFSTWLTGVAFNLVKNHISRTPTKHHVHLDIDDQPDGLCGSATGDPTREYENKQLRVAMAQAVAALPASMRDAIILVANEGLSYEETAETLGIPVGTVKSRLCRARLQLADALRAYRSA